MKRLKFSHSHYLKLQHPLFPTIRRRDKYPDAGERVEIATPQENFEATVVKKVKMKLGEIPTIFLRYDTAREGEVPENREEAMDILNSFYVKPLQDDEEVTVIFCLTDEEGVE